MIWLHPSPAGLGNSTRRHVCLEAHFCRYAASALSEAIRTLLAKVAEAVVLKCFHRKLHLFVCFRPRMLRQPIAKPTLTSPGFLIQSATKVLDVEMMPFEKAFLHSLFRSVFVEPRSAAGGDFGFCTALALSRPHIVSITISQYHAYTQPFLPRCGYCCRLVHLWQGHQLLCSSLPSLVCHCVDFCSRIATGRCTL